MFWGWFFVVFSKDCMMFLLNDIETLTTIMKSQQGNHVRFGTIKIMKSCDCQTQFKRKKQTQTNKTFLKEGKKLEAKC